MSVSARCRTFQQRLSRAVAYAPVYWPHTRHSGWQGDEIIAPWRKLLPGKALLAIKTTPTVCGFCILAPCQVSIVASQIGTRTWEGGKMNRNQFSLLFDELPGHREPNLNLGCKFWAGGDKEVIRCALLKIEQLWKLNVSSHLWQIIDMDGSLSASPATWPQKNERGWTFRVISGK